MYFGPGKLLLFHRSLLQRPVVLPNSRITRSSRSEGSLPEHLLSVEKADTYNSKSCAFWHHVAWEVMTCPHRNAIKASFWDRSQLYLVYSYAIWSSPATSSALVLDDNQDIVLVPGYNYNVMVRLKLSHRLTQWWDTLDWSLIITLDHKQSLYPANFY